MEVMGYALPLEGAVVQMVGKQLDTLLYCYIVIHILKIIYSEEVNTFISTQM